MDTLGKRTTLDSKDIEYCQEILNETKENEVIGLQSLQKLIEENKQWNVNPDVFNLVRFLRSNKYNIEKAKKKLKNFYRLRGTSPEWFANRNPLLLEIQELLKIGVFLPLLHRDDSNRMVVMIRIAAHNPYLHKQNDVFKTGLMILDLVLDKLADTSVYGVNAIFDMNGVSYGHAKQLTVSMIKKAVHSWQDCYPVRVSGFHFINSPIYINVVLNIFRSFMREKMRKRVHVHGFDKKSLHKVVPERILPEEYGGTGGKLQNLIDYWKKEVSENYAWYAEDEKFKYIED